MVDFKDINQRLLARSSSLVPSWLPGGSTRGHEWVCAGISGGKGESFSVNLDTGAWAEFNNMALKGGDLVSLYAAVRGLTQIKAAQELSRDLGLAPTGPIFGKNPTKIWKYQDKNGSDVAAIARYDAPDGKKSFIQQHFDGSAWVFKAHPELRPLYNLPKILSNDRAILIVEGEKTCDAAIRIVGKAYTATTWMGGAQAIFKTDWSPCYGRRILLIPDADKAGTQAMSRISDRLSPHCPEIKICDVSGQPDGWDLADQPDWDWNKFYAWAKPRISIRPEVVQVAPTAPVVNNIAIINAPDPDDTGNSITKRQLWDDLGVPVGQNGQPINNLVAVKIILNHDNTLSSGIWYDEFHKKIFFLNHQITDSDEIAIAVLLQSKYGLARMEIGTIRNAIIHHAFNNVRNEPKDWITSLKWDGQDRVSGFLPTYYGSESDEYHASISRYFWAGIAARIMDPGCKLDCMVVLQGSQGTFKSTSMHIIGGKWYFESCNEVGTKDFLQSLHGVLIMEIGELDSMKRARNEAIKNTLSTRVDHFRVPYGRNVDNFPRQCVFVGTTNEDNFIGDQTGGRRFYPVTIGQIDLPALTRDRDQLFAQALQIYQSDPQWWYVPEDSSRSAQEDRRITDPWEELINTQTLFNHQFPIYDGIKTTDIAIKILRLDPKNIDRIVALRITSILKHLGFRVKVKKDENQKSFKAWSVDRAGGRLDGSGAFIPNNFNSVVFDE